MHDHLHRGRKHMARTKRVGGATVTWTRAPLITKKRTARRRKATSCVRRKIKVLQELVPNAASMGLDGLFAEAANYIVCLQVQVKAMQIMLDELPPEVSDD